MKWTVPDKLPVMWRRFMPGAIVPASGADQPRDALQVPLGSRLRWLSRHWLSALGWPGVLALGLLVVLPAFYFSAIRPLQVHVDEVRRDVARQLKEESLAGKPDRGRQHNSTEEQLAEYYRFFPPVRSAPQWLEKLVALAESRGLSLDQGEYLATPDKASKLMRFQMTLPLKGEYPQIRKFLAALPAELPSVSLEKVQFERQTIADPEVEARIRLVLYLGRSS
ncbi:MAG TPA: GspMb/PilO family protein [Gallionella sp.]|nr:GspMb/PilO family protein [Gallionella sp.]